MKKKSEVIQGLLKRGHQHGLEMFGYECKEVSIVWILDFCFSSVGLETVAKGPDEEMMSFEVVFFFFFEVFYVVQTGRWLSPTQW